MTHKLTRRSAAKGLALSAASLALPAIGRAEAKSVKIAMIAPMSGPWARQGQLLRMGADLAVEDINAHGGIKALRGAKLDILAVQKQQVEEEKDQRSYRYFIFQPHLRPSD